MLNFHQLTKQQRTELKQKLLGEISKNATETEYAKADTLVSDEQITDKYGESVFSPDDFNCTKGKTDNDCIIQHYKDFYITHDVIALKDTIVEEIQKSANAAAEDILSTDQLKNDDLFLDITEALYNAIADQIIGKAW